jgi:hypothetical protein
MVPSRKPFCGTSLPAPRICRECFFPRAMPAIAALGRWSRRLRQHGGYPRYYGRKSGFRR